MRIRKSFVTNSSSSNFVLHLNKLTKEQKKTVLEMIRHPMLYRREYINWMDTNHPWYVKDNPNKVPYFIEGEIEGKKAPVVNPEYEKLPEVLRSYECNDFTMFADDWDVRRIDANTLDFSVDMDDFDFLNYLKFSFEKVLGKKFKDGESNELIEMGFEEATNAFIDEFITGLSDSPDIFYKNGERWNHKRFIVDTSVGNEAESEQETQD